ncbi:MAG: CBS domain-containing protein, partial [Candidatus Kapaibacterium sp.]
LISTTLMKHTIMTEKIARRGLHVPSEYAADHLARVLVRDAVSQPAITLRHDRTVAEARAWLRSGMPGVQHGGFPVLDEQGELAGVVSRKEIFSGEQNAEATISSLLHRAPAVAFEDNTLREAADLMVMEKVGRLPIVLREDPLQVVGILTRSDLLHAHESRLEEEHRAFRTIPISSLWRKP